MNEWRIVYIHNGQRTDYVMADTLERALTLWRREHPSVPGIALESVICIK